MMPSAREFCSLVLGLLCIRLSQGTNHKKYMYELYKIVYDLKLYRQVYQGTEESRLFVILWLFDAP